MPIVNFTVIESAYIQYVPQNRGTLVFLRACLNRHRLNASEETNSKLSPHPCIDSPGGVVSPQGSPSFHPD